MVDYKHGLIFQPSKRSYLVSKLPLGLQPQHVTDQIPQDNTSQAYLVVKMLSIL